MLIGLTLLGAGAVVENSYGRIGVIERHAEACRRVEKRENFYDMLDGHLVYNREIEDAYIQKLWNNLDRNPLWICDGLSEDEKVFHIGHRDCLSPHAARIDKMRYKAYTMTNEYMNRLGYDSYWYHHHPEHYDYYKNVVLNNTYSSIFFQNTDIESYTWEDAERLLWFVWDRFYFDEKYLNHPYEDFVERYTTSQEYICSKVVEHQNRVRIYEKVQENRRLKCEQTKKEKEETKQAKQDRLTARRRKVAAQPNMWKKFQAWLSDPCS